MRRKTKRRNDWDNDIDDTEQVEEDDQHNHDDAHQKYTFQGKVGRI